MKNNKLNILLHSISSVCIHIQYISYVFNYMNTIEAKNFGSEDKYNYEDFFEVGNVISNFLKIILDYDVWVKGRNGDLKSYLIDAVSSVKQRRGKCFTKKR